MIPQMKRAPQLISRIKFLFIKENYLRVVNLSNSGADRAPKAAPTTIAPIKTPITEAFPAACPK